MMPHYKSGTAAAIGDIVKGRGYNIPHEIIGKVTAINQDSDTCNLTIACVTKESMVLRAALLDPSSLLIDYSEVRATLEYGQADAFEKIC
jgi:hypothetical protein